MNIKNIFDMARADKYTKDGREEIIKAQETEDARRYKTGEISEATGLQKQPDGSWAPPKGGAGSSAKKAVAASPDTKRQTVVNFLMKKSQVPEESAKKAAEGLTPGLLNQMYNNIKKDHGDKYDAAAKPAENKTFTFTKAGHVYNVPASSPAEAVQKLNSRGVKGFKESDAHDDSTPRNEASNQNAVNTFNKITGSKETDFNELKAKYDEAKAKNTGKPAGSSEKKDVAAEQTARNEAMKAAENESQNAAVFNDLNEKAATEGIEYKIRKTKAGEYYWDKYRDGKHVGGGSARDMTDAVNRANKNFKEYIKENKPKKIEVPKNAGRGDYIKINGELVKVDYAQEGRYGSELGTLLQYEDPDTGKNRFVLQLKNGTAKDVTKEYLNGAYDAAPRELTGDSRLNLSQVKDARRTYKIGEISEKTGLQKTANGWVEPKKGAGAGGATARVQQKREAEKHEAARKDAEQRNAGGEQKKTTNSALKELALWEKSAKNDARLSGENQVVYQDEKGNCVMYAESDSEGEAKAEAHGYKKMSLVRPDGSVKQHQGNNPAVKKEAPKGTKKLTRQDNTIFKGNDARELNNNVQAAAGGKRDISAENRAYHEKVEKERADRNARAENQAKEARKEAEARGLTGQQMKDMFLAKTFEGASVSITQRGMEAQGWSLTKGEDGLNVYEKPDGSKVTMQLEGNKVKSAEYQPAGSNDEPKLISSNTSHLDAVKQASAFFDQMRKQNPVPEAPAGTESDTMKKIKFY